MQLTLDQASTIIDTALAKGRADKMNPLCAVVLDTGGHLLALKRDERAPIGRPQIAIAKASGCLHMGFGARQLEAFSAARPAFAAALGQIFPHGMAAVAGGVLIRNGEGVIIGAVGISGDTSDNDEICAIAGIKAAGLVADNGASA